MFGYLSVAKDLLSAEDLSAYKSCYCGICRCMKERHGQLSRLTLNYDMTFLALFLDSLYEPEEACGEDICIAHPFQNRPWCRTCFTEYAADMTVALAFLKLKDNWKDDGDITSAAAAGLMSGAWKKLSKQYPEVISEITDSMLELKKIESSGEYLPDEASDCFGRVLAAVFAVCDDRWTETVKKFAFSLGKYIYILDAAIDLDKDRLFGRYNPFRPLYGRTDNPELFCSILKVLLSDCLVAFDALPLVKNASLMKNILCIGLWSGFVKKFGAEKGPFDVSGSV